MVVIDILTNTMFGKVALLAVLLAAVQGDVIREDVAAKSSRSLSHNLYFAHDRTVSNGNIAIPLPLADELPTVPTPNLEPGLQTIVIVHGHGGNKDSPVNEEIRKAFFDDDARPDIRVNIIVVDWSDFSSQSYAVASAAVQNVGKALGQYLQHLIDHGRIDLELIHLIGFNLGAHVVGFAGRELNGHVPRITGLDPSGSNWGSSSPRLRKSDAQYVEVIHTDGDGLLSNGIGTALGDVDFFVNGGSNQPGCLTHACSHNRAYYLYAATLVRDEPLQGRQCTNTLQITLNTCRGSTVNLGGDRLIKQFGSNSLHRVNTGRNFPF